MNRDEIRDALADWVGGRLEAEQAVVVERAVAADDDLRQEAEILRAVGAGREEVPVGLENEILGAVLRDRRRALAQVRTSRRPVRWRVPAWAVGAAATVILAFGTLRLVSRSAPGMTGEKTDPLAAVLEGGYTPWVADDGTVAGAPLLDGLSEEALASLLEEMGG